MTPERAAEIVNQTRDGLAEIKVIRAAARDRVRVAYKLGIRKEEIHQLSGLARSTIDRYLGHQPKRGTRIG